MRKLDEVGNTFACRRLLYRIDVQGVQANRYFGVGCHNDSHRRPAIQGNRWHRTDSMVEMGRGCFKSRLDCRAQESVP